MDEAEIEAAAAEAIAYADALTEEQVKAIAADAHAHPERLIRRMRPAGLDDDPPESPGTG